MHLETWWENLASGWATLKNYFEFPVTSSLAEGVNNVIKSLKRKACTIFSMFQTMNEAYKVQALRGEFISPTELLYLATQGGADVLGLGDQVGSLIPGKRADFQILDWRQQRLLAARFDQGATAVERLFATIMLGA